MQFCKKVTFPPTHASRPDHFTLGEGAPSNPLNGGWVNPAAGMAVEKQEKSLAPAGIWTLYRTARNVVNIGSLAGLFIDFCLSWNPHTLCGGGGVVLWSDGAIYLTLMHSRAGEVTGM
jgi:hypothetical protein